MKVMNLAALVLDQKLQSRVEINQDAVDDYAHAMENGDKFPALTVFFDGVHYYLADGYQPRKQARSAPSVRSSTAPSERRSSMPPESMPSTACDAAMPISARL